MWMCHYQKSYGAAWNILNGRGELWNIGVEIKQWKKETKVGSLNVWM